LMLQMMAGQSDPPRDWHLMWAQYPAKKALFRTRMIAAPPFPPALDALLKHLQARYRLAVVSSSSCDEIEPLLEVGGLRGYFETVVGGNSVKYHKPAPDPYLLAAERLQVSQALVLEDSDAGAVSGQAAGFEVLRIQHPTEVPEKLLARLGRE
jgi:beta-phosphoglucomutase